MSPQSFRMPFPHCLLQCASIGALLNVPASARDHRLVRIFQPLNPIGSHVETRSRNRRRLSQRLTPCLFQGQGRPRTRGLKSCWNPPQAFHMFLPVVRAVSCWKHQLNGCSCEALIKNADLFQEGQHAFQMVQFFQFAPLAAVEPLISDVDQLLHLVSCRNHLFISVDLHCCPNTPGSANADSGQKRSRSKRGFFWRCSGDGFQACQ